MTTLTRYELRKYNDSRLIASMAFATEQEAEDYFKHDEDMEDAVWGLYKATYTENGDHVEYIRTMHRIAIRKEDLRFIGHLRGIDQYEVINQPYMKMALVLELNNKYYLSFANSEEDYNKNIASRITLAYKAPHGIDTSCLGEFVLVV